MLVVVGEQICQPLEIVEPKAFVQLRSAQVGIHQQHFLTEFGQGFGEQHIHQRLAFRGERAGEGNRFQGAFAVEKAQGGVKVAEGFLVVEALVALLAALTCILASLGVVVVGR